MRAKENCKKVLTPCGLSKQFSPPLNRFFSSKLLKRVCAAADVAVVVVAAADVAVVVVAAAVAKQDIF